MSEVKMTDEDLGDLAAYFDDRSKFLLSSISENLVASQLLENLHSDVLRHDSLYISRIEHSLWLSFRNKMPRLTAFTSDRASVEGARWLMRNFNLHNLEIVSYQTQQESGGLELEFRILFEDQDETYSIPIRKRHNGAGNTWHKSAKLATIPREKVVTYLIEQFYFKECVGLETYDIVNYDLLIEYRGKLSVIEVKSRNNFLPELNLEISKNQMRSLDYMLEQNINTIILIVDRNNLVYINEVRGKRFECLDSNKKSRYEIRGFRSFGNLDDLTLQRIVKTSIIDNFDNERLNLIARARENERKDIKFIFEEANDPFCERNEARAYLQSVARREVGLTDFGQISFDED
ncbi:hypothetical protein GO986_22220 [Deinococcus sp. HMF7620]|uniref:Uncharacterized protein n=2 Tax=Deinococcus arboris TaxID=2682977 RepID=A0A7C9HUL2_9DEIO|nr:hypothetical protein [Deinococcus arboris]